MKVMIQSRDGFTVKDLNRKRACRETCLNCSGWVPSQVRDCTFNDCPLYSYRMGRGRQDAAERAEDIRRYCIDCQGGNSRDIGSCPTTYCPLYPYRLSTVDRSVKVKSKTETVHIERISKVEILKAYQPMHQMELPLEMPVYEQKQTQIGDMNAAKD